MNAGLRRVDCSLAVLALLAAGHVHANVVLVGPDKLGETIDRAGYCCVVDARASSSRKTAPIGEALEWREGLTIKPAMAVVVLGDTNESALSVGEAVARTSNARQVIVVEGGAKTWAQFLHERSGGPPTNMSFIVPKNTCEPGQAVLELEGK